MPSITFFISCILLVVVRCNNTLNDEVIDVPARTKRDLSVSPTHFYFKYQNPSHFKVSVSDIYIPVPGLRTVFNVAESTLFEITYQGSCEIYKGKGVHIKLLVDDHLIVGDQRTPNKANRHLLTNPISGETAAHFDQWLSQHHLPYEYATLPIIQSAVVLVRPGRHIFDLGVHHGDTGNVSVIFGGTMRFKWSIVDSLNPVRGLTMWNGTSPVGN
ncbi:unnamed protein product [Adineta ricciae]|uniref:Uncharacterized protein n=1 Tax=Adineta ricciae TaxID=249248 RepID=A0A813UXZ7_ADIRI|nr:unnamed protein product [Adineta ricciae]CAF1352363.1 unnamed protein product [Adineta ricciae]